MLALNAILSYNINLWRKMTIETQPLPKSQIRLEKPVNFLPIQRVKMLTPTQELDGSSQKLTLEIDGKQISVPRKSLYTTRDVLSMIRLAKGLTDSYLISPLIKNIVGSEAVKAKKIKLEGKMTYGFREQDLAILINTLLPRIDPYVSLPK